MIVIGASDQAKLSRAWAEAALQHIARQPSMRSLGEWIAVSGWQLGLAEKHAHEAWLKVRLAIGQRFEELG